jgi:hypothetical protein
MTAPAHPPTDAADFGDTRPPHADRRVVAQPLDPQLAHAALPPGYGRRRRRFLSCIPLSDEARDYRPKSNPC